MSVLLYRLGIGSFRRRGLVVVVWLAVIAGAIGAAATLSGPTSDTFTVPGTESQRAIDVMAQRFPDAAANGATARVVLVAPEGTRLEDAGQTIDQVRDRLAVGPNVARVGELGPDAIAADGRTGLIEVSYRVSREEMTEADRDAVAEALTTAREAGMTAEAGADAAAAPDEGAGETIGVLVAAVVLLITLGSLLAAGLPLLVAAAGLTVGLAAITAASGFADLNTDTSALALMLGIAVAIDYSLFIILRYRQLAAAGYALPEAAGQAVGRAGSTVLFAGLTVVIALAGLTVVGIPALTQVGLAAAFTVAMAVIAALTLLPALLGWGGERLVRVRSPRRGTPARMTMGRRWAATVVAHRLPVLLGATAILLLAAVPALDLRLGFPDDGTAPADTTQRKAYDLIADGFGAGANGPLTVVVDAGADAAAPAAAARVRTIISGIDGVAAVAPPVFDATGATALLAVVPGHGPADPATTRALEAIRDEAGSAALPGDARVMVTGQTALDIDSSAKLRAALLPYLALVGGLAFVLLILVFRSVLVPLVAAAGFLLSVAATFGVVVAVFQWGWFNDQLGVQSSGIIVNLLPVMLVGMVFGLAMDYQVFLVTRMREEHLRGQSTDAAIVDGFAAGARVVTAAAIIMISVFAGFLFSATPMVQSFGFALAAAVLFDAFLVRMTAVPAMMSLLGRHGWWLPRWLDRLLPEIDVEGRNLDDLDGAAPRAVTPAARGARTVGAAAVAESSQPPSRD
ncbi:MMPL family transporter [Nocardia cyriacigeorgica]|uniref:MMPL family transporter n=3 Tax=Nocardia cyriacigeorgica TaxID=135487 RepID=UPI0018952204|nr:MMPL family transporter [Nocardia cyriacigeorgica]MBF6454113.1 MMPL family transporter [Nocardia cyriacigeorgica]MBF6552007.1 MMPL family transporter [Nocardia cyriacigeorgica]